MNEDPFTPGKLVVEALIKKKKTIAIAETFTGGLLTDMVTNVPGASKCLIGSLIAYTNQSKIDVLGVEDKTIRQGGIVSDSLASEMAHKIRDLFSADYGLASTGLAGPSGAYFGRPIGSVFFAFTDGKTLIVDKFQLGGDRIDIKREASTRILKLALELIQETE